MATEASTNDVLTLRELVVSSGLGLEVVAGRTGMDRSVEAVYIGDLDDPTPWMVEGSLLLTTGPRFEADPHAAARLVELLKQSGMVGVGVAIMPHVREIPIEMLRAADREGLPLIRVPEGTPFREITGYVFHALTSRDMHRLRRSVAVQKQLLEVLLAEQDPSGLVRRVGELLGASTLLFAASGKLVGSSLGQVDPAEGTFSEDAWEAYRMVQQSNVPRSVLHVGTRHVAFREVRAEGVVEQVFMVAYPEGSLISEFADEALTFAQRLLEVELATGRNVGLVRRRTRAGLLDMLMHGRGGATELGERLLYHGIEPTEALRLVALSVGVDGGNRRDHPSVADAMADALLGTVDRLLEERRIPFVSRRRRGQVLVLTPLAGGVDADAVRGLLSDIAVSAAARLRATRIDVGVSSVLAGLDAVSRAVGQARLALRQAGLTDGATGVVVAFDDMGRRYKILDLLSDEQLQDLEDAVLGRLRAADKRGGAQLLTTLETYLAHGGSVVETSAELFVHRNTLRKRLTRVEQILGIDLATSGGLVEAYIGVRAADVLATRRG